MMAQRHLAQSKDKRALATLMKAYGRYRAPRDQSQYFTASTCALEFDAPIFIPTLAKWRNKFARPEHAWLWYQTLLVHAKHAGPEELVSIARGKRNGFLRAAAVEALAALRRPEALEAVTGVLTSLPKDDAQRAALINAAAGVLLSRSHEDGSPTHHGLARNLMDLLDQPTTPRASKVVIARHLQRTFDIPYAFLEAAPWRQVLASVQALMEIPKLNGKQALPVELAGIKARGMRIAYLVDFSAPSARETTAEDSQILRGQKPDASADVAIAEDEALRILAMRKALRASIQRLAPEQSFAVICTRHLKTDLVPGCTGLMPAIERNKATVLEGLIRVAPESESDLHTGLQRAFALTEGGFAKQFEYVGKTAALQGCDTVFVLGQSSPVRDAWVPAGDAPDEPLRMTAEGREVHGLYSDAEHLAEELRRWNLFRKAEIHGVAIGDAPKKEYHDLFRPHRGWNTMAGSAARIADEDAATSIFEAVRRAYEAYMRRPSLHMRMRGRRRLAKTRDVRALDIFARSYARPEMPEHRVPHLVASLCADHFTKPEHLARFHAWRGKHHTERDAWLWYRTGLLDLEHGDANAIEALAHNQEPLHLQLAAARAIAAQRKPNCVPLASHLLGQLPAEGPERSLVLEVVAVLLHARGHMRSAADFAAPAETLIMQLKDAKLPRRTRQVIARHLAKIFRTDMGHGLDADKWMRELKGAQATEAAPEKPPDVYAPYEFIGIPSAGGRVCYVVDASDSMLEPVSDEERRRLSRVVTGAGKEGDRQDALPWDKIHTRFDIAREYLKLSLRRLTPDKAFAIVLFGTDAKPLPSTPSLVAAKPSAVSQAIRDLNAIKAGPKTDIRPLGTLRGFTNMHGGLDLAFRMTPSGLAGRDPYVDPKMLALGVETIFLLSDGDPSTDDYRAVDRPDAGDVQADPETRAAQEKVPDVTYYGPYVDFDDYLVDDVRRMNLFRNAEIHCVGIGEANTVLLRELAACGLGETRILGQE